MKEIRNKWKALVLLVVLALMFGSFTVQAQDPYPGPGTEVPTRQPTITPIPSGMASYCGYTVDTNACSVGDLTVSRSMTRCLGRSGSFLGGLNER